MVLAGFLAAYAAVIELQVGPVSAILGLYLLAQVAGGRRRIAASANSRWGRSCRRSCSWDTTCSRSGPPGTWATSTTRRRSFAQVHNAGNPLGLGSPDWTRARDLLWGGHRGLLFYAPIVALAVPGWVVLASRRLWGMASVSASGVAAIFLVNLSYPEWTGGWSTGPRFLVPLLPFAMLPVAALLAVGGRWATLAAVLLTLAGGVLMLLFQGVGARIPNPIEDPLLDAVLPLWRGDPLPGWATGGRFTRNVVGLLFPRDVDRLPPGRLWVQFLPLVAAQASPSRPWSCHWAATSAPKTRPKFGWTSPRSAEARPRRHCGTGEGSSVRIQTRPNRRRRTVKSPPALPSTSPSRSLPFRVGHAGRGAGPDREPEAARQVEASTRRRVSPTASSGRSSPR